MSSDRPTEQEDWLQERLQEPLWWTPDGIGDIEMAEDWYNEQAMQSCPYYVACHGGRADLPGAYGPGTCGDGTCRDEPRCMT